MEKQQEEMQFLGLIGIYKESYNIILSRKKIFTKITLSLILPLSFIFLAHRQASKPLTANILQTTAEIAATPPDTPQFQTLTKTILSEYATLILFNLVYAALLFLFSLLSTSAVVYTIAATYTAAEESPPSETTLKKVMTAVPKVWKRLLITSLCTSLAYLVYAVAAAVVIGILSALTLLFDGSGRIGMFAAVGLSAVSLAGFVYLAVVWELASVVSVLEDCYGFGALKKSRVLIKGKTGVAVAIFLTLGVLFWLVQLLFDNVVVVVGGGGMVVYGVVCLVVFSVLVLVGLVFRTVIYFVCKSYHHENIDKSALWDHLQVFVGSGEYEPLTSKDVSLEKYQV